LIDEAEFLKIYRNTVQPLYRFVIGRAGGQRELAEDTVQETWMRAMTHWQRKGLPRVPLAWLQTVSRNLLISYYRRVKPETLGETVVDLEDDSWNPEQEEEAALLYSGLARLGKGPSRLLEAFYFDGKSVSEIAGAEGLSERAVEGRLRRARIKLGKKLRRFMPLGRNGR